MDMASQKVLHGLVEEKLQIQHSGEGQGDLYTDQLLYLRPPDLTSRSLVRNSWAKMPAASQVRRPRRVSQNSWQILTKKEELLNQLVQAGPRSDESFAGHCALVLDNFQRGLSEDDGRN
jgi:hypothetical protein